MMVHVVGYADVGHEPECHALSGFDEMQPSEDLEMFSSVMETEK